MKQIRRRVPAHGRFFCAAACVVLALSGCSGAGKEAQSPRDPQPDTPLSRATFAGDSLTAGMDLEALFPSLDCLNLGVNGDTVAGLLARLDEICDGEPECVVLLIGVNDLSQGVSVEEYLAQMDGLLAELAARLPECRLILQALYPINSEVNPRLTRSLCGVIAQSNDGLRTLAEQHGFLFCSAYDALCEKNTLFLEPAYTTDGIHISDAGYQVVAAALTPFLS